jgi:hypothetical protein
MEDAMPEDRYRLKTRLPNGAEFEAEGTEAVVQALFDKFLEASRGASPAPVKPIRIADEESGDNRAIVEEPQISPFLNRIVTKDKASEISLTALPKTQNRDADALLILLYGFQEILGRHAVTGVALKKAAKQSGIQLLRVDRLLGPYGDLVNVAGFKKGRRYGLNNQGVRKAQQIIEGIMG